MTAKRLALIYILAHIVLRLYQLASEGAQKRRETDETLLSLGESNAYLLGYVDGYTGEAGYWPDYERTEYDDVPGVGRVWRASPAESAYWRGWHEGEDSRDHTIH